MGGWCTGPSLEVEEGVLVSHDLEDADILPRMQAERLWPVVVNGYPQFGTTGKHGNPSHKCRQSVPWAEIDVLCGPWVVAAD